MEIDKFTEELLINSIVFHTKEKYELGLDIGRRYAVEYAYENHMYNKIDYSDTVLNKILNPIKIKENEVIRGIKDGVKRVIFNKA